MSYYEKYLKYKNKYLKLKQTGGEIQITDFSNLIKDNNTKNIDFTTKQVYELNGTDGEKKYKIRFSIIKNISGGSGDTVYLIAIDDGILSEINKTYVYKIFNSPNKNKLKEIELHKKFIDYFQNLSNNYIRINKPARPQ